MTGDHGHAAGYMWLNIQGRHWRQRLLAQALHMAPNRPKIMVLVESQPWRWQEEPPL